MEKCFFVFRGVVVMLGELESLNLNFSSREKLPNQLLYLSWSSNKTVSTRCKTTVFPNPKNSCFSSVVYSGIGRFRRAGKKDLRKLVQFFLSIELCFAPLLISVCEILENMALCVYQCVFALNFSTISWKDFDAELKPSYFQTNDRSSETFSRTIVQKVLHE